MHQLAHDLAIWVAILVPIFAAFVVIFLPLFTQKSARRQHYLKRVAKKYSVPPLNLR